MLKLDRTPLDDRFIARGIQISVASRSWEYVGLIELIKFLFDTCFEIF